MSSLAPSYSSLDYGKPRILCEVNERCQTPIAQQAKKTRLTWSRAKSTPKEEGGGDISRHPAGPEPQAEHQFACIIAINNMKSKFFCAPH
jgi:hypothetical protein